MPDYKKSVARLSVGSKQVGTAWLITPQFACTANHCFKVTGTSGNIVLNFKGTNVSATVEDYDKDLDVAILRLNTEISTVHPLECIGRPTNDIPNQPWLGYGFPPDVIDFDEDDDGIVIGGKIRNFASMIGTSPRIQVRCEEGGDVAEGTFSNLCGISGGPIVVRTNEDFSPDFVVGLLSRHRRESDDTFFCVPVDVILNRFPVLSRDAQIKSWDASRRVITLVANGDGSFESNLDDQMLEAVWQSGLKGFYCKIDCEICKRFSDAVERLIVHAKTEDGQPPLELQFSNAALWNSQCQSAGSEWVPLESNTAGRIGDSYSFLEIRSPYLPKGGVLHQSINELTESIQAACDRWVMKHLPRKVDAIFDDPRGHLRYVIADETVAAMKDLWEVWKVSLKSPVQQRRFFALMITHDGTHPVEARAVGAGPRTLDRCILHSIGFSLAICAALSDRLHAVRADAPGNLGDDRLSGHSSGIETIGGMQLQDRHRFTQWQTAVVILPHLKGSYETFASMPETLEKEVYSTPMSITHDPDSTFVINQDAALMRALEGGLQQLRNLLDDRFREIDRLQQRSIDDATNVA